MIKRVAIMEHRVQNPPLNRLQSVAGIRQRAFLNNVFGVTAKPLAHDLL